MTPARVAVDLGAESCRVSLLRWVEGRPGITLVHRIANGPVAHGDQLRWDLRAIWTGVEEGLRRCADIAVEGIASIAVDGWATDYAIATRGTSQPNKPYMNALTFIACTRSPDCSGYVSIPFTSSTPIRWPGFLPLCRGSIFLNMFFISWVAGGWPSTPTRPIPGW
jgi:hypothetical protein